jgi:hypothetical protein
MKRFVIATLVVDLLVGCSDAGPVATASPAATPEPSAPTSTPTAAAALFPIAMFGGLG